jgi:hypothetical protein
MKKIIAAAVATAFVAPAFAADISIGGSVDMTYANTNTGTSLTNDSTWSIKASSETPSGISVGADLNMTGASGDDGGASLTLGGTFGTIDIGDTSSATDAIDDITDVMYAASSGTGADDAAVLWTLPTIAEGATVYLSHSPDTVPVSGSAAHSGISVKYAMGPVTVGAGQLSYDNSDEEQLANVKLSVQGVGIGYERRTVTVAAGTETEYTALGAQYSMGDITLAYESYKKVSTATDNDITAFAVHYNLGGGLTVYAEAKDDSITANSDITYFGATYAF